MPDTPEALLKLEGQTLLCQGEWTLPQLRQLRRAFSGLDLNFKAAIEFDFSGLDQLDSAGALVLCEMLDFCQHHGQSVKLMHLSPRFKQLLSVVQKEAEHLSEKIVEYQEPNWFYRVGLFSHQKLQNSLAFFAFIGEFFLSLLTIIRHPRLFKWSELLNIIDDTGARALSIVALMAFLIGVVLAYQLGAQLKSYGANIYVVQLTGVAILREFGPLITAIIIAGRTSTSFSALIGTMKVNEELDALNVMGKTPIITLVIPRVIALFIALPLLVVWADLFSVMGSMMVARSSLGIQFGVFLQQFQSSVAVYHYIIGMLKVPIFALVIAAVGCFQGLRVQMSADSVGRQTTQAAVQSIFLIIIVDAFYSVVVGWLGW